MQGKGNMFLPSNGNRKPTNGGDGDLQEQPQQQPERSKHIEVCVRLRPLSVRSHLSSSSFFHKQPAQRGSSSGLRAPTSHRSGIPSRSTTTNSSTPRKPAIPKFRGNASATPPQPEQQQQQQQPNETRYAWDVIGPDTVSQEPSTILVPGRTHQYTLDRVYGPTTTTASVYDQSVRDLVLAAMEGYHTAVLAYGQTSTGKTHTMTGTAQEPGLIPLAVRECFVWLSSANTVQQEREYLLRVSYLEVYKEHIKDLLATTVEPIRLFEHAKQGLVIRGLKEEVVTSPNQVFSLLAAGEARRHTGATQLNQHSSRSHVMVRLWIESKASSSSGRSNSSSVRVSSLSLVDLAGSESVRLTGSTERQAEGHYINKSLMTLGKVVYALSVDGQSGQQQHVPYRDSKLTRLLQPSLSGSAQVVLVCCISPLASHVEESHNTFKFAIRAKKIPQKAVIHEEDAEDKTTLLQSYRDEIEDLKQQLQEAQEQLQQTRNNTSPATNDAEVVVEEEMHDLIQAIQTMEKLILKTKPLGTNNNNTAGDETVATASSMMDNDSLSLTAADSTAGDNNNNTPVAAPSDIVVTTNLQSELTRIQNMLGTVLAKRHSSATTLRDLRAQLEEQEVTGTLLSADASFLQQSLIEKDALLADVSKLLADVEERQTALETENRALRRELALLRRGGAEL